MTFLRRGFVAPVILDPCNRGIVQRRAAARLNDRRIGDASVARDLDAKAHGALLTQSA